jgi:hypothetical protein
VIEPVIGAGTFGVIVLMVIVTTLVTPPALKRALARRASPVEDESTDALREVAEDAVERTSQ